MFKPPVIVTLLAGPKLDIPDTLSPVRVPKLVMLGCELVLTVPNNDEAFTVFAFMVLAPIVLFDVILFASTLPVTVILLVNAAFVLLITNTFDIPLTLTVALPLGS